MKKFIESMTYSDYDDYQEQKNLELYESYIIMLKLVKGGD